MGSLTDRERLRRLAAEYAEIATGSTMQARREVWRLSNRLEARTVPFQIEDNGSFFADLCPKPECEGATEQHFERQMLQAIANYRLIDDDRVCQPYFAVHWWIQRPDVCPELRINRVPDATGRPLGFDTNTPLADLANSFHKLRRAPFSVDRQGTLRQAELATAYFGDLLPVKIITEAPLYAGTGMAGKVVLMMGMDAFYMAMIDQPEPVHRLFEFLATEGADFLDWLEAEKLITPNHGEFCVGSGSCGYTDELPRRVVGAGEALRPEDCWGFHEAQEAVGMSPEMYAEFIHAYQRRTSERYGLLYYGCCEPVHTLWPVIQGFRNLRKITISPWCDQAFMAKVLGRRVVASRKPHPLKLTGERFDGGDFRRHIQETLDTFRDNFVELIFRDTCALNGGMEDRVAQACRIVHELVGR
jgi:hypothetical protein